MSERENWKLNVARPMIFKIFDPDTGLAVTGRDLNALVVVLLRNAAVPGSPPIVTITELTGGRYLASYSPNALGYWYLEIDDPLYNVQGFVDELTVVNTVADDPVTLTGGTITAIATAVLTLPLSSIEVSIRGVRCLGSVIQRIRNKVARKNATTFAVYEQDNTTEAWTATVVTDPTQKPVVSETPN